MAQKHRSEVEKDRKAPCLLQPEGVVAAETLKKQGVQTPDSLPATLQSA